MDKRTKWPLPLMYKIIGRRWAQTMDGREVEVNVVKWLDIPTTSYRLGLFAIDTNEYVCDIFST